MTLEELYKANKSIGSTRYTGGSNFTADKSNLNIDRIPSRYSMTGKLYTAGDTSKLNVDGISKKYHG